MRVLATLLVLLSGAAWAELPKVEGPKNSGARNSGLVLQAFASGSTAMTTTSGAAISITRTTSRSCEQVDGTLTTVTSGNACVTTAGLSVFTAATNLVLRSEEFDNATWTGTATVSADSTVAADGATTADTVTDGDGATLLAKTQAFTVANDSLTHAFRLRALKTSADTHYLGVQLNYTVGTPLDYRAVFNTNTCAVAATSGTPTRTLAQTKGSWCLFLITGVNNTSGNTTLTVNIYPAYNTDGTSSSSAAATGSKVLWGAMLVKQGDVGAYIPTAGTTATRNADVVTVPTPATLSTTEGCSYICFAPPWTGANPMGLTQRLFDGAAVAATSRFVSISSASTNITMTHTTASPQVAAAYTAGTSQCYRTIWSAARNTSQVTNVTTGVLGTAAAFVAMGTYDANIGLGGTSAGGSVSSGVLSDIRLGSSPDACSQ